MLLTHQKKISDSGVIHTGISDHSLVFAIRKIPVIDKQENILEIIEDLLKQSWEHIYFSAEDPYAMWEIWKKNISRCPGQTSTTSAQKDKIR